MQKNTQSVTIYVDPRIESTDGVHTYKNIHDVKVSHDGDLTVWGQDGNTSPTQHQAGVLTGKNSTAGTPHPSVNTSGSTAQGAHATTSATLYLTRAASRTAASKTPSEH